MSEGKSLSIFEVTADNIVSLGDSDLRELIGRLCEADLRKQGKDVRGVSYGGDQNAPDGGLDVYVEVSGQENENSFVPRNITGFQVKVPDMTVSPIKKEMCPKGELRSSIKEIVNKKGAYIIACSSASASYSSLQDRLSAMKECIKECNNNEETIIEFYDRSKIATWVNQYPECILWVKEKIGQPVYGWKPYEDWSSNPQDEYSEFLMDNKPCMYKSSNENNRFSVLDGINKIRKELLKDKASVRLVGLSGTGKTRLLYALFDNRIGESPLDKHLVIYCDIGENPNPTALHMAERMIKSDKDIIMAVDNCSPKEHKELSKICRKGTSKVKLITVEYDVRDDSPEETITFCLEPSSKEVLKRVLSIQKPDMNYSSIELISQFSDGNYRVALALSSMIEKGEDISELNDEEIFERLFLQRNEKNRELLEVAEVLSLVYSFDSTYGGEELELLYTLCELSGLKLMGYIKELESRKLIQSRGIWKALLPHAIANRLAKRALKRFPLEFLATEFNIYSKNRITKSFYHRLSYLHDSEEANEIVNFVIEQALKENKIGNPFDEFWGCLNYFAAASPEKYLFLIEQILKVEDDIEVFNFNKKNIISNIQDIGYELKYFRRATDILIKISCNDKEIGNNSAQEALKSIFGFINPKIVKEIDIRINVLRKLVFSDEDRKRVLGENILSGVLSIRNYGDGIISRFGSHYLKNEKKITLKEIKEYYTEILRFISNLILDNTNISNRILVILVQNQERFFYNDELLDIYLNEVNKIIEKMGFCEGWVSCLSYLKIRKDDIKPEERKKIENLRDRIEPRTLEEKIKVYAFEPRWNERYFKEYIRENNYNNVDDFVISLGVELIKNKELLDTVLPQILTLNNRCRTFQLGVGLAKETEDRIKLWSYLLMSYKSISGKKSTEILEGYINYITIIDTELCEEILDKISEDKNLIREFIRLQINSKKTKKTHNRILKTLNIYNGDLSEYVVLAYGHKLYSDDQEITELIDCIYKKRGEFELIVEILYARLSYYKEGEINENLISNYAVKFLTKYPYDQECIKDECAIENIKNILNLCIKTGVNYKSQMINMCKNIYKGIINNTISSYKIETLVTMLANEYPKEFLDIFLPDELELDYGIKECLGQTYISSDAIINKMDEEIIQRWCQINPCIRYKKIAEVITPFNSKDGDIQWKSLAIYILEKSKDKKFILECYYSKFDPNPWSGSKAEILKTRIPLLQHLEKSYTGEVQDWVRNKQSDFKEYISKQYEWEKKHERIYSERFE